MAYETAPHIKGVIYNADIITTDYDESIYESVDALLLDIQSNPSNYGVTDEVVKVGCKATPANYAPEQEWKRHRNMDDIIVWTICEGANDNEQGEYDYCGSGDWYEGQYWCGWHESLQLNYKWREMVTVVGRG